LFIFEHGYLLVGIVGVHWIGCWLGSGWSQKQHYA